jgi:hypothetical protein
MTIRKRVIITTDFSTFSITVSFDFNLLYTTLVPGKVSKYIKWSVFQKIGQLAASDHKLYLQEHHSR